MSEDNVRALFVEEPPPEQVTDPEPTNGGTEDGLSMLRDLGVDVQENGAEAEAPEGMEEFAPDTTSNPETEPSRDVSAPPSFSVQRMVFVAMVEQAIQVVPSADYYPAFKNLFIEASEDHLTVTGSDSTATVLSHTSTVRVERPGSVQLPAKRLSQVVSRAAGSEVTLRCSAQAVEVTSGGAAWSLRPANQQDYPPLPDIGDVEWSQVDRSAFDRAIAGTRYAASTDPHKDHLQQLDVSGGQMTAADGTRFARVVGELPTDLALQVSTRAADLLTKMLARNDAAEFRLASGARHLVAEIGPPQAPDRLIVAHLVRSFPAANKRAIDVPLAENRDELTIDADALSEALRRAAPTADDETEAVALRVGTPDEDHITIATRNRYGDTSTEEVAARFRVSGSDRPAKARTVVVGHKHLERAVRAAAEAAAPAQEGTESVSVRMLLGENRSKGRPAYLLVQDASGCVQAVLSQTRSDYVS